MRFTLLHLVPALTKSQLNKSLVLIFAAVPGNVTLSAHFKSQVERKIGA